MWTKHKTIPTIIGLLILIAGFACGLLLVEGGTNISPQASADTKPKQIKITNLSDTGFTISWLTDKNSTGYLKYGNSNTLGQVKNDLRDIPGNTPGTYQIHYVTLDNLTQNTKYFYKIGAGNSSSDNNGQPYEVTTASTPTGTLPQSDVSSGIIVESGGNTPASGVIVYLTMANMTPLSAITSTDGNWLIPLNSAFSTTLSEYATYDKNAQNIEYYVEGANRGTATAATTTKMDNPIPVVELGKTYDFRSQQTTATPTLTANATPTTANLSKFSSGNQNGSASESLDIVNPDEGEKLSTVKPEFIGTGPANQTISITVESPVTFSGTAKTDSLGNWKWTPPSGLSIGEHQITISLNGETIIRKFTVFAADNLDPAFTATPSSQTPTPTKKITPTPTITPTVTPTPVVNVTASPTPLISPTLTTSPTPTPTKAITTPTTATETPVSGNTSTTMLTILIGLIIITFSLFLKKNQTD